MRLSDSLMVECGGHSDIGGIFTNVCTAIRKAERFELTDDVARAGYNLTKSKPTTLLNALPLCRAPYRKIWLEWRGGLTTDMIRKENKRDPRIAPDPIKQGCLIETDETGQRGTMIFAWIHKPNPDRMGNEFYTPANIAPLGTLFNWEEGANVTSDARRLLARRYPTKPDLGTATGFLNLTLYARHGRQLTDDDARQWMERSVFRSWGHYADKPDEREALLTLGKHAMPFIPDHTFGFFQWCAEQAAQSEDRFRTFMTEIIMKSWEPDIEGEPPFVDTIIAMMNSRNAIENRTVDLSALNKARVKRGRPEFLPYRTTHLRLSQAQTRAFRAGLLSREDAGRHRVRGHFKIRKTGVYWWSPFFRGDPAKPVHRQEYKVET